MKQTRINVEHRRSLLMELVAKGYTNQRQLALRLHVSPATVNRDFEVIAERAKKNVDGWIDSKLPLGFKCLLIGNEMIIRKAWEDFERSEHKDELEERKYRLEVLQFLESLYWHKRNYLIDNDNIMLQLTSHQKPTGKIVPISE
jgi:hypothetical protein